MTDRMPQQELLRQLLLEKYEPIAIIGMGLRFPGDNNTPAVFDQFLRAGGSGIVPIPEDRWDSAAFWSDADDAKGKVRTIGGGFLRGIDQFDPKFFNISPKEADYIDPQQRLVLETAWEALEDANVEPTGLRNGNGAVYLGVGSMDYLLELGALDPEELDSHLGTGTAHSAVSGRLSYFLGWRGPCVSVDTACSSSLVAVHLAVEGLRSRECDIALAGGVNAIHHPTTSIVFSAADMLAPDGQCKTFDDTADGYARSEGCGVLVLKRFSDAKRDGDTVLALVRGSAVRQDGESAGLTVPNGTAQEAVMRAALGRAMLTPADIHYVEAHGTGTPLGDPIEMGSINDVFADSHSPENPVIVGSVKTNVGHMEIAAGVGGIVKTVLQLRSGTIYPHRNLHTPSSRIPWGSCPVTVATECLPWPGRPRRALVNSFGFTGTIATAVLEQAPPSFDTAPERGAPPGAPVEGGVFTLSAKSTRSLRRQIARYQRFLVERPEQPIGDLCYTSNVGRAHFPLRIAGAVRDSGELAALLAAQAARLAHDAVGTGEIRKVALLFTGQGAQYPGMAAALYRRYPVFRQYFDESDRLFKLCLGRSITPIVFGEIEDPTEIHQTRYTQPGLFAVEYATARLWLSWGVRPSALIGHSIGEIVAATVAGLFTLEDAVALVAVRARLMHSVSAPGGMVAVRATPDQVMPLLAAYPDLAVAAVNAPEQCVLSGGRDSLAEVVTTLTDRGIRSKPLEASQAFHSPLMAQVREPFRDAITDIRYSEPELTLISTRTGKVARFAELASPDYWVRQISEPVNFMAGMRTIEQRGRHVCIEMGPGAELTALGKRCVRATDHLWLPSTQRTDVDGTTIRRALARFYTAGLPVSWTGYHQGNTGRKIGLPTYAFDHKRYWLPSGARRRRGVAPLPERLYHPLLGREMPAEDGVREFAAQLGPDQPGYLRDHVVLGQQVVPGAAYLEMLLALQDEVYGQTGRPIDDLRFHQALLLSDNQLTEVRTRLCPQPDDTATVTIVSVVTGPDGPVERCHATATLRARPLPAGELIDLAVSLGTRAATSAESIRELSAEQLYADFVDVGVAYGPAFQLVRRVTRYGAGAIGEPLAIGELSGGRTVAGEQLPPTVLDCAMQIVAALADTDEAHLPVRFDSCQLLRKPRSAELRCLARLRPVEPDEFADAEHAADLVLLDGDELVFVLRGLGYKRVTDAARARRRLVHEPRWVQRPARSADAGRRHVLLLGGTAEDFGHLATRAAETGCRLSFATDPDDAALLLAEQPTDVCWFWRADTTGAGLRGECERNYRNLLDLLRVLDQNGFGRAQRLWLVTQGAQWLAGDAAADTQLAAATLWGFGQTLRTEYPAYQVRMVDLDASSTDYQPLMTEWLAAEPDESQLAYRGGRRYVRRLHPTELSGDAPSARSVRIRPDRTYLITGGLGALGRIAADHLVALGARRLALASRRPVTTEKLAELEARFGTEVQVTVYTGNVGDATEVHQIVTALRERPEPVGGIIHAAGVIADAPVAAQTWDRIDTVFQAKVYGSWLLHQAAASFPDLEFFVGYSSIAAVLGLPAQANYAAGNAFLDTLMRWRAAQRLPGMSVNWGPWSEVGMAANLRADLIKNIENQGIRLLKPAEGMRTLVRLLDQPVAQAMIGEFDWNRLVASMPLATALYDTVATPGVNTAARVHAARRVDLAALCAQSQTEREATITALVRATIADALHFDPDEVEVDAQFTELGLDSLAALALKNSLEAAFGIPLAASITFDHPSVRLLARFLDRQLAPKVWRGCGTP